MKRSYWILIVCLLPVTGAWLFWPHAGPPSAAREVVSAHLSATTTAALAGGKAAAAMPNTNKLAFRLSNTTNSLKQLVRAPHAILLANAFIDTDRPLDLKIPPQLQAKGDPGFYIVQARGPVATPFRTALVAAGAQIVSYIPNNAYLVRATAADAGVLAGLPLVQAVLPYEPYYKVQSSLLGLAVDEKPLPPGTALNLGLFAQDATATEQRLETLGAKIIGRDQSAFGPVLRVLAPENWTALAQVPGVQIMEPAHTRVAANDLSRVTVGISPDTTSGTTNDYFGLSGRNVLVAVNDSGIDMRHPDLAGRVFGVNPIDLVDTNGHGTHVAGIIGSSGVNSINPPGPTDVGSFAEGSVPHADFRGKAPLVNLFALNDRNYSDYQLQTNAAMVGAPISNNSWDYGNGAAEYDLAAASYDAATRDALPFSTGSKPVLFVFAAGNSGGGSAYNSGSFDGSGDTILSPGTAKNVITVGALEQLRNITNWVTHADGTSNQMWMPWTDSDDQVAWYSSRGNVGIGTEGNYGRFKPDLVSPGTFVVSTRSSQWDTNAYYNATNNVGRYYPYQLVASNGLAYYNVPVPANAIAVIITIVPNKFSIPFPANMPIYARQTGLPSPTTFDIMTATDGLSIPPSSGGAISGIQAIQGNGFNFAVGNPTNVTVNFDVNVQVLVTNGLGNQEIVLMGMNETLAPYYRYETGTSMAAADVSGVLALMEDYFTNTLHQSPSPALMKALLLNGARSLPGYALSVTNGINFQGWGLDNIQNIVPGGGLVSQFNTSGSSFFVDQNPTTALATGDSHTFIVNIETNNYAQYLNLQATLVWTDPPGDPSAAIKLVNNLDLIITNLDTGDVYFGNDISSDIGFNAPWNTNNLPNLDSINNVENIFLQQMLAGSYSVTVVGRAVNVNAVTAQTNNAAGLYAPNIVQDFALVISVGEGEVTNAFTVADSGIAVNPTGDQDLTIVTTTNTPLFDQFVGASSPLLGTNTIPLGTNTVWGPNGVLTIGMTNQWHFYVVTNTGPTADYTNAAFITFDPYTLAIPRMGAFADSVADATRTEADIDLFVTQDSSITNLNPVAISNCLAGVCGFGVGNAGASLSQGGTEFVFFTNSAPGQVYYVGVQSQDQMASEYAFLPVFTDVPFSQLDKNGNQIVRGLMLPMNIPDGNNAHPGVTNVFALAVLPMVVEKVTVTNLNEHQNFGDLFGALTFGGKHVVLNNHDGLGNTYGTAPLVYDDSRNPVAGTRHTDGPGKLVDFRTKSALGPWILGEMDNSYTMTGQVSQLTLVIQPHRNLKQPGVIVSVPPGGWFIDYVDVPAGYTNLTFAATNVTVPVGIPPIQMYEKFGNDPTLTDYDQRADLTNGLPPGNTISIGPPLAIGQYFVGLYNPGTVAQNVYLSATLGINASTSDIYDFASGTAQALLDDAVSVSTITVPNTVTQLVASVNVGLVVNSPRISDYTFTLVSPTGQSVLLMENRGAGDTNGAGQEFVYTNILNSTATGGAAAQTNYLQVSPLGGTVPITYNFYTVPDEMTVYQGTNNFTVGNLLFDTGFTNNAPAGGGGAQNTIPTTINVTYPPGISAITIIMNQFGNPYAAGGDAWIYTAGAPITNYQYLVFTDDTNLATVPIKYAQPPFDFNETSTNYVLCDFNLATNGDYHGPTNIYDAFGGWTVPTNLVTYATLVTNGEFQTFTNVTYLSNNLVSVISDPSSSLTGDAGGSNLLALANGTITRSIATTPGRLYNVTFWYRGPGIEGWYRGEGNASDSSDPENNDNNGTLVGRFNFPAGEVGQAFQFEDPGNVYQFAATNTYVQIPASASLNVGAGGGFTVEGWINPTNLLRPQPLVEWLAHVPTNTAATNVVIVQGPVLDPATGHYYYLLAHTNWTTSETWAQELGGHLVTIDTANEQNWVYDTFTAYGTLNRDLWIGFTNNDPNTAFGWSSGLTNFTYTNWMPGLPFNVCSADHYTAISGPTNAFPGLWMLADNQGRICGNPQTNPVYGVVEVNNIPTNGVQFWISGTNWTPGITNYLSGCLYANIVDTNYVSHPIWSAPGLLTTNVYQHVALTFNTNSGIAALYLNGTNVATTNLFAVGGPFVPKTDGDVLLGWDMSLYTNNFYAGKMDEMSIYSRALSLAEISDIYQVSAFTTNRLIGKFDPSVTPAVGLAEALVSFGGVSNVLYGVNNQWEVNSFTFTAASNSMPVQITGLEPGVLLDSFSVSEAPETNLYYLPEEELAALNGTAAAGNWILQVWDNRVGAYVTNLTQLLSWQLSFVLVSNAVVSASLPPEMPVTTTVPSGQTVYYSVTVPAWAHDATNILVSSSQPVNLYYYNPTNPPANGNPADLTLLNNVTSGIGSPSLVVNGTPPLLPGQTYYLGVQNNGGLSATVTLEVDYDILNLTNGVPYANVLNTNEYNSVRYFEYDVSSNAYEATFQLLALSGNADLVISKGAPLPMLGSSAYGSFNVGTNDESIYVLTNSSPVPLSAGRWFLGVWKRDTGMVTNTVLAKELDATLAPPTIINLTNGVPFNWTAGPGAALTNFFRFLGTNFLGSGATNILGVRFEVYNQTGNGDLTVQTNAPPLAPPFFQTSQNPGRSAELVYVHTNSALTNLAMDWYLGVPNNETTNIHFTIVAVTQTNLYFPAFPDASGAGEATIGGRISTVYHVTTVNDSGPGSLRAAVNATNRTVVFDIAGSIKLLSPLEITNSYVTIAGQTAPGSGITVAGNLTTVSSAHDVILRDVRFRSGNNNDSLNFQNVSNVIADHVSASWSQRNLVSVLNSSNVTVQWSLMADSLYVTNNSQATGSLLREGGGGLSFHHNLYADNYTGSPRLGDNLTLDFVNNVIYNWGVRSGLTGGTADLLDYSPNGYTNRLNYVCNYLIAGPDTAAFAAGNYRMTNIAFFGGVTNALAANWFYQTNNFIDSDTNGVLNGAPTGWGMFTNQYTRSGQPFYALPVPVDEAYIAYERVLDFAGVNLTQRDPVDTNIVSKVRYQTGTLISVPSLIPAGLVDLWKGETNANDSINTNNDGTTPNGMGYELGEIGNAFDLDGNSNFVLVANANATPSLNVGSGAGFTFTAWVNPTNFPGFMVLMEYENGLGSFNPGDLGVQFDIYPDGSLYANIVDTTGGNNTIQTGPGVVSAGLNNNWQLVALTYNKASGLATIYYNGSAVFSQNLGSFTPQTSYGNFLIGADGTYGIAPGDLNDQFVGGLDEVSVYNRDLTATEIQGIYTGSGGQNAIQYNLPTFLDTDQDGIPDFWETTFATDPFTPSNNNDRNGDGYTDLEEYNDWLAVPHAFTVTNTPVGVDLNQLFGQSGRLAFSVTNGVHGLIYLTNVLNYTNVFGAVSAVTNTTYFSNSFAIFTPTNSAAGGTNYCGYASFDVYVTNLDTTAYFGPVTVSVVVSAVPIAIAPPLNIIDMTSGVPYTNCNAGGSDYYHITVTTNDYAVLFELDNRTGPMSLAVRYGLPLPSLSSFDYFTNAPAPPATEEIAVITNSAPVALAPGDWYMSAINVNPAGEVCYSATITKLSNILPPQFLFPTNSFITNILETVPFSVTCLATDLDTPQLPLSFALVNGPAGGGLTVSNNGVIRWTPTEAQGPSTNTILVSVSNGAFNVTNSFTIVVEESNLPPVLPFIPYQLVIVPGTLTVTNTAHDPDIPANALGYFLTNTVTGTNVPGITTNGIITWTPTLDQARTNYLFTTVVTDTNPWAVNAQSLSATNSFYVLVLPPLRPGQPDTNVVAPGGINWFAITVPTNAIYATNLLLFASLPVNLWFSTNVPPSTNYELLVNVTNGSSVLSTNVATAPTNIVPGGVYFLGVQNTNSVPVTNAVRVDFALAIAPPSLPFIPYQVITLGNTLIVTNTATDLNPGAGVLAYQLPGAPAGAVISAGGIITWTPSLAPTNALITTIVTDTNSLLSATNSFYVLVLPPLPPGQPDTNVVGPNSINWFVVSVPTNAIQATNLLLFATAPLNLWFSTNVPPTITNSTDAELLTNSTAGSSVISTNTSVAPTNTVVIVPGGIYYLGVQNTNSFPVTNAIRVDFNLVTAPPVFSIFSIIATNIGGSNGFLLTWFAPTGYQFHMQWTPALVPANWTNFNGVISFLAPHSPTNGLFQYFDDGSQTGGFGSMRFYRLLLLNSPSNTAPFFLTVPANQSISPLAPLTVANPAKDWDVPAQTLTYHIANSLAGTNVATIDPVTGVITWTPTLAQNGQTNVITTTVTDNGVPAKSAVNIFTVIVEPVPPFSSIFVNVNGVNFQWLAPTNEVFQIEWTTNLLPPVQWTLFPNIITSTNGVFNFVDTNTPLLMKFYMLLP